jgi:hypothetical protein
MASILIVSSRELTTWSEVFALALKAASLDLGLDAAINLLKAQFKA